MIYPLLFQRSRKLTFLSSNTRERLFKPLNVTETHRLQHLSFRLNCPTISDGQLLRRKAACFLPTRNVLKLFNTNTNRYVNESLNTCAASILNTAETIGIQHSICVCYYSFNLKSWLCQAVWTEEMLEERAKLLTSERAACFKISKARR